MVRTRIFNGVLYTSPCHVERTFVTPRATGTGSRPLAALAGGCHCTGKGKGHRTTLADPARISEDFLLSRLVRPRLPVPWPQLPLAVAVPLAQLFMLLPRCHVQRCHVTTTCSEVTCTASVHSATVKCPLVALRLANSWQDESLRVLRPLSAACQIYLKPQTVHTYMQQTVHTYMQVYCFIAEGRGDPRCLPPRCQSRYPLHPLG